jgi:ABC-type transporter Mla subunit MlaD
MQTTSQNPIVNTNYFFSGSQLTESQQGSTDISSARQEGNDDLEGRVPVKGEGTWRKAVSAQLGTLDHKLDGLAAGQSGLNGRIDGVTTQLDGLYGQLGNLDSQMSSQTRRLNSIDSAVRASNGKLDKLSANDDLLAAGLGKLSGQLEGVDASLGRVDDSLKALVGTQGEANLQLAALNGKVDAGFSALTRLVQSECTTPIPHSPNRAQETPRPVPVPQARPAPVVPQAKPQQTAETASPHAA